MTKQKPKDWSVPILVAVIGLIGTCLTAFFAIPGFQIWVGSLFTPPNPKPLAIEQIPQKIFPFYGEVENVGGFAKIELIFDGIDEKPSYELIYSIPSGQKGYAGMAFQFTDGSNLSKYNAVECTVVFSQLSDVVDLYFKDIASNFNTIRVSNNGANEMMLRYEFANFPSINFNAVKEFGIVINADFSSGIHHVQIKKVRFVK